jgi:hypothetical protein
MIVGSVNTPGYARDVAVSGGYAYVADEAEASGLVVVDVHNPASPTIVGGGASLGGAAGVAVSGNWAFVAAGFEGLHIFPAQCDVSVTAAPVAPVWDGGLKLAPPAPNPFARTTALSFTLPARQTACVAVYDVTGRLVRTIVHEVFPEGGHTAIWNGRDHQGQRVGGGTYFVRLQAGGEMMTRKVVFLGD